MVIPFKRGETMVNRLFYDQEQSTWNVEFEGNTAELLKMNENGTAQMALPNGEAIAVMSGRAGDSCCPSDDDD